MKILMKTFLLIAGMSTFLVVSLPREMINSFHSDIEVHYDSSMTVTETIRYHNADVKGLHGIIRDFPTRYRDRWGNNVVIDFDVQRVLRNGFDVLYRIVPFANGKRVYIGDSNYVIPPGTYTYTIVYTTSRQLGFFDSHDELYWNVTGVGWPFPILEASARVTLPSGVPATAVEVEGYTGSYASTQRNLVSQVDKDGVSTFSTTGPLGVRQGLTIVVSWPKGFVNEPAWYVHVWNLLRDNLGILWLIIGLIIVMTFYLLKYRTFRKKQQAWSTAIIPRFYPPRDLLPSEIRYIYQKKFDARAFAAEIVNMAVNGMVLIEYTAEMFNSVYTLQKNTPSHLSVSRETVHYLHDDLQSMLFAKRATLHITQSEHTTIERAMTAVKRYITPLGKKYLDLNKATKLTGVIITITFVITAGMLFAGGNYYSDLFEKVLKYPILALYVIVNILFVKAFNGYTREGIALYEEIEGFKMFLGTTETERIKLVGTPPDRTPELYETYLPYAMALGVEQRWSAQFAPIFAQFERDGHPYVPVWYVGPYQSSFLASGFSNSFATSLSNSLSSAISSAATPPGSSSGRGGGGSSGGGGGGGGGGSW